MAAVENVGNTGGAQLTACRPQLHLSCWLAARLHPWLLPLLSTAAGVGCCRPCCQRCLATERKQLRSRLTLAASALLLPFFLLLVLALAGALRFVIRSALKLAAARQVGEKGCARLARFRSAALAAAHAAGRHKPCYTSDRSKKNDTQTESVGPSSASRLC